MKLLINIPEDAYNYIKANGARIPYYKLSDAIKHGTVLPKGHGRLIDGDALKEKMKGTQRYFHIKYDIDEAPTIIEADIER